jgi:DNA-binding ferritin-like protein (Dps family)
MAKDTSKLAIIKKYISLLKKLGRYPTMHELKDAGVTRNIYQYHFKTLQALTKAAKEEFPEIFEEIFTSSDFTPTRLRNSKTVLKDVNEFIITTVVADKPVFQKALDALDTWANVVDGAIICQPIEDPAAPKFYDEDGVRVQKFDSVLSDRVLIWGNLELNKEVLLSGIKIQDKQLNPHTGLERIAKNTALTIVASTKQRLTPLANMAAVPGYIVSGGAITMNVYESSSYASQRTGALAESEHVLGGVYVKILGKNRYEFTPIQFDSKDGHFTLNGTRYYADGTYEDVYPYLITLGDLHAEELAADMFDNVLEIIEESKCKEVDLHDVFSGIRCSPFNKRRPELQYLEMKEYKLNTVVDSLQDVVVVLNSIAERTNVVNIIDSNHHAFLEYWITSGAYRSGDPRDVKFAHILAAKWLNAPNTSILQIALDSLGGDVKLADNILFHKSYISLKYLGIERCNHGHVGAGGIKAPSLRKLSYQLGRKANTGHTHKSQIVDGVWSPGTLTGIAEERAAFARKGPNDWSNSLIKTYDDGQRNLEHLI